MKGIKNVKKIFKGIKQNLGRKFKKSYKDIGINLGTANTVVYVKGENIVINEPTYVAINTKNDDEIEFIGKKAKEIMGRTPRIYESKKTFKKWSNIWLWCYWKSIKIILEFN